MDFERRLTRLRENIQQQGATGAVVVEPVDLYYLTGLQLSAGMVLITQDEVQLLVDGRYFEMAKAAAPMPVAMGGPEGWKVAIERLPSGQVMLFDSASLVAARLFQLQKLAPTVKWHPFPHLLHYLRLIKEFEELTRLRAAAKLATSGFDYLAGRLRVGVTEEQLARELEIFWLQQGGHGLAFDPIVAFGPHAALPHHRPTDRQLTEGQPVLLDMGVTLDHYQSDMTRVLFFGAVDPQLRKIYTVVREAFEAAVAILRPGVTAGELDRVARELIGRAGYGEYFLHSLGHGIGLEVHEAPTLRQTGADADLQIEANMVLTIEPGIYLSKLGGVRLEDTFVVTQTGCESLTQLPFLG